MVNVPFRVMTSPWDDFVQSVRSASPLIATCLALMIHATPFMVAHPTPNVVHVIHNVRIGRELERTQLGCNGYRCFELSYLDGFQANKWWTQGFCPHSELTAEKGFDTGFILDEFGFVDRVTCWDTDPDLQGYWFNRKNPDGSYVRQQ